MPPLSDRRHGFTLVEVLIALVIGLLVIGAAMQFAVNTVRTVTATELREGVARNSRFVAMSLERDFQATGVGIESTIAYGSIQVRNDTVVVLSVPFDTTMSQPYDLIPPPLATNPLPAGGTCGATCLDLMKAADSTFDIQLGDIARLQVGGERRLIHAQSMTESDTSVQLTFTNLPEIVLHPASLSGGLLLDPFTTFAQKVQPIAYWVESGNLLRATRIKDDGSLGPQRVLFDCSALSKKYPGAPDGMKVDKDGIIWTTGPGGVLVISPQGKLLGHILTGQRTANCNWGDDGSTLYMTADFYICRLKTKTKGAGW